MSDPSTAVTLTVDGLDYAGWTSVEITASLECQARKFTIGIAWKWPGQQLARPVQPGARCELRIGGELVITGWVDAAPIQYNHDTITATISGRSLTGDLCDCAAINRPGQWKGQSAQAIVAAIAGEYGVAVKSEVEATASLADHTIEPGETAFHSIDRLLTLYQVFSTDNAEGQLVLAKAGSGGRASDSLEVGRNVLGAQAAMDFAKVFSEYRVIGQRAGTDQAFGVASNEVNASASDPRVTRRRVKVTQVSGQLSDTMAAGRASWERSTALGKALETTYQVQGWRQANGALWLPNTQVRVLDPLLGFDRDMIIAEVTYHLTESGTTCTLRVGPPQAYLHDPDAPKPAPKAPGKDAFGHFLPTDGAS